MQEFLLVLSESAKSLFSVGGRGVVLNFYISV